MKTTRLDGLWTWSEFQAERGIDFSGYYWATAVGGLLIDPMQLSPQGQDAIRASGGVRWILITSAEHLRAAPDLKSAFGAQLAAPSQEQERLGAAADQVDVWFESSADLPEDLQGMLEVYPLRGGKAPMEPALHLKPLSALYFGDVVRSHVSGVLRLLPDEKLRDRAQVVLSLQAIASLTPDAILLGDGDSLYTGAARAFADLLGQLA